MNLLVKYGLMLLVPVVLQGGLAGPDQQVRRARAAYQAGRYNEAYQRYQQLLNDLPRQGVALQFNAAQAAMAMDSVSQAANLYQRIQHDLAPRQLSQALNHLGMHSYRQENRERALALFRQALQASPANRAARYNFELLKRRMQQDPPPPPPKPKPRPAPRSPKARPTEKAGARLNMPPLPLPQARQELRRMRKEQPQFIQELKKEAAQSQGYSNKPQW